MELSPLFVADLRADVAAEAVEIGELVDRWAYGRPSRRSYVRRQIYRAAELGHITIDADGMVQLTSTDDHAQETR